MDGKATPTIHTRRNVLRFAGASAVGLALNGHSSAEPAKPRARSVASGPLRSAGVLTFGPDNVLFVGDIADGAVHAFSLRDSDFSSQKGIEVGNYHNFEGRDLIQGIDLQLASLLGSTPDNIVINDVAIHQPSEQIFLSVERGRGSDAVPAIIKVNGGKLEVLALTDIPHSSISIPDEPAPTAKLEFDPQRMYAITDIQYYKGEVFVTGITNQRFASTVFRIPFPFSAERRKTTVEIWHPVHAEFETRAPIIRQHIQEFNGEPFLFAVYGCTPLVRFPLASLTDGAHVRGDVIGELGYGSNPIDMMTYQDPSDGKDYLLVTIDTRGGRRVAVADLQFAPAEPANVPINFGPSGLGLTARELPILAEHTAFLNSKWAVILWRHPRSTHRLDLSTLASPYFFERKDGMSEMNWPDGPDPFGYRTHRGVDRL